MMRLGPFSFDLLSTPWALLLLAPVLALLIAEIVARPGGALTLSTAHLVPRLPTSGRMWLRHVPALLRALGLAFLVVALAGPLHGYQVRKDRGSVIDIMLCLDTSGSMQAPDFRVNGQPVDRLQVAKEAVQKFIDTRKGDMGKRFGMDRLGLILYARYAWTQCPLTLDYGLLEHELSKVQLTLDQQRDGTAIGSAIGLAVQRLRKSEAKSKVAIVLTDGRNNKGELDPLTAADIAKQYGIKVYTIGAGAVEGSLQRVGLQVMRAEGIDEETMQKIAEITGGRYYRATDTEQLLSAYEEIAMLERTEIDTGDYYQYKPAFIPWAITGALALCASLVLRRRWFEVVP